MYNLCGDKQVGLKYDDDKSFMNYKDALSAIYIDIEKDDPLSR